ncbi:hypothetical protein [Paraburkholderia hiiakae]|uniref:hypothetical protein n=1 Tax=Paraburkholderia hiiakae TaxID=1081782 RepID=UPI00191AE034|nr:hypothetical protein [Paraburkholderia hiiakae]
MEVETNREITECGCIYLICFCITQKKRHSTEILVLAKFNALNDFEIGKQGTCAAPRDGGGANGTLGLQNHVAGDCLS